MGNKLAFILGLALVVVCVLFWRSCQSKPSTTISERDKSVDSIIKIKIADSIRFYQFSDSMGTENAHLWWKNDSLSRALLATRISLGMKGNKIEDLVNQYEDAKKERDSSLALTKCDSLVVQVTNAKALVFLYANQSDSLQNVLGHLIKNKDTLISRLSGLYQEANNQVFQFSRLYNLQSDDLKKAQKNANKRWGVGPQVGIGIAGSKIGPYIGVGVQFNLFKF